MLKPSPMGIGLDRLVGLLAVAVSVLSLAGVACKGERSNYARDASSESGRDATGDQIDAQGEHPVGTTQNGSPCSSGTECLSGFCPDRVCCDTACDGTCMTCAAGATPGTCSFADPGTDPRAECPDQGVGQCGTTGVCNGSGACRLYSMGTVCDATPSCDSSGTAVLENRICNGTGACVAGTPLSCGGYRCNAGACGTTCAMDSQCAASYFCSAGTCVSAVNLAGNGDLETGTTTGWSPFAAGTLGLSSTTSGGLAHGGQYSVFVTDRTQSYQGPSYPMPSGLGQYAIVAWGMQKDDPSISGVLQYSLVCATTTYYVAVQTSGFGVPMKQNIWTMFSATIDTSTAVAMPADCDPNATPPGVVKSAVLYLNQVADSTLPVPLPALYLDDLVLQIPDGHNLVGNPNFEAGVLDGWSVSGSSTLAVSATVAHGGTHSLWQTGRTTTNSGPRYTLPTGTARYNLSLYVRHSGTATHNLALQVAYTCIGAAQVLPPPVAQATAVAGNAWTQLSGTLTLPPASAAPGCKLAQATVFVTQEAGTCGTATGQVECPDLFVDDASITVAP